jgi:hypothetical protein
MVNVALGVFAEDAPDDCDDVEGVGLELLDTSGTGVDAIETMPMDILTFTPKN